MAKFKKYLVVYQEEFYEDYEWSIQTKTNNLEKARKQKTEMLEASNIIDCKILEVKEVE